MFPHSRSKAYARGASTPARRTPNGKRSCKHRSTSRSPSDAPRKTPDDHSAFHPPTPPAHRPRRRRARPSLPAPARSALGFARPVHARRRLGRATAGRHGAVDAARARPGAGRRHGRGARGGAVGDSRGRALSPHRDQGHRQRRGRPRALGARRSTGPAPRPPLLVPLHRRRRAQPRRPHAHRAGRR
ncbi:hypothetical protein D9M68_695770 [compost metagenome]